MIVIPLTMGQTAVVDDSRAELLTWKWYARYRVGGGCYAQRFVARERGRARAQDMHRAVMEMILGRPLVSGEHVDHIDGDGLNNTDANLRVATVQQNVWNQKRRSISNTSGYTGVSAYKGRKWQAKLAINKRHIHLGFFDNILDAARAYDVACIEHRCKFASPNYPAAAYGLGEWP
jgi:hypothetical protein